MKTLIDTILETKEKGIALVENAMALGNDLQNKLNTRLEKISQIILDGHGSSKTAAFTAQPFIEKITGLPVTVLSPNDLSRTINPCETALYVFVSESGNSALLRKDIQAVGNNALKLLVTASSNPALGDRVDYIIHTGCEDENFFYHTVGHCCAMLSLMLLSLNIALLRNTITKEAYRDYLEMARSALNNQPNVVAQARQWCQNYAKVLNNARCLVLFGSGPLYGIVEEAGIKIQEITQNSICKSFPTFQKIYGSTSCHDERDLIFMLYDGIHEAELGLNVLGYVNETFQNGFLFGNKRLTDRDFYFEPQGQDFSPLEYIAIFEVIAYEMTIALGKDVPDLDHMEVDGFTKYMNAKNK